MVFSSVLAKVASTVVTGAVGVAAYNGAVKVAKKVPFHEAAVATTALGLRGVRKAEEGAETARLKVSDVVAEARERIGEEVPPPGDPEVGHGHGH